MQCRKIYEAFKETRVGGLRARNCFFKDIKNLKEGSGQRKKRLKYAREHITTILGQTFLDQQKEQFLNELINKSDVLSLLKLSGNQQVKKFLLRDLLKDMNLLVNPSQIQEVCDTIGVSRKGYRSISNIWFQVLRYYKIKAFGLPRPQKVGKFRLFLNAKILENFGDYDHIDGAMPFDKGGIKCSFEYNVFNNIWMNVRKFKFP